MNNVLKVAPDMLYKKYLEMACRFSNEEFKEEVLTITE